MLPTPDDDDEFAEHVSTQARQVERKIIFMLNQIDLMLNAKEDDHIALMQALRRLSLSCSGSGEDISIDVERVKNSCKLVLKREWERLKQEA